MLCLKPITIRDANAFVGRYHRHNHPTPGGLFAVSAALRGEPGGLVGVAIVGRPLARQLADGFTAEIVRLCTTGERNACSLLYGACLRAAKALGYRRVVTYTLEAESGASLRAVGLVRDGSVRDQDWTRPSRPRLAFDLFGQRVSPSGQRVRWVWRVSP